MTLEKNNQALILTEEEKERLCAEVHLKEEIRNAIAPSKTTFRDSPVKMNTEAKVLMHGLVEEERCLFSAQNTLLYPIAD